MLYSRAGAGGAGAVKHGACTFPSLLHIGNTMAFIEIQRRCQDCEKTRQMLSDLQREVRGALLDYQNLYDKVRTNLGKLAKRQLEFEKTTAPEDGDALQPYRAALVARKLGKGA